MDGVQEGRKGTVSAFSGPEPEVRPLDTGDEECAAVAGQGDLQEVYDTERHLLDVACTRAREPLLVTGVLPPPSSWTTWPREGAEPPPTAAQRP